MALPRRPIGGVSSKNEAIEASGGLFVALPKCDPAEVRDAVISGGVRALEVQGKDLAFLEGLPLEFLTLNVTDPHIDPVNSLRSLRGLYVDTWHGELDFEALPNLEWFGVTEVDPERLDALAEHGHPRLRHISIGRYRWGDLRPLERLPELVSLTITDSWYLAGVRGVEALPKLRAVEFALCYRLASLAGLEDAAGLECVDLHSCNKLEGLAPVARLGGLRLLQLELREPPSLTPFSGHPTLEFVWLVGGKPLADEIDALRAVRSLVMIVSARGVWVRTDGEWERIENIYDMTPAQQARYDELTRQRLAIKAG